MEIFPSADNRFFLKVILANAESLLENGRVGGMMWRFGGSESRLKKVADQPAKDTRIPFSRTEVMIPMRDGVKLFTVILAPENQTQPLCNLILDESS